MLLQILNLTKRDHLKKLESAGIRNSTVLRLVQVLRKYKLLKWIEIYMLFEAVVTDAKSKGTFLDMVANYILYLHFNESKIAWVPYLQSFYAAWRLQYALYWSTRIKLGILHKINMLLIVIFFLKYPGQQKKIMLIEIP